VHTINDLLGNTGKTVIHTESLEANPVDQVDSLHKLVTDMNAGKVDTLIILGGNPVYNAPFDFGFGDALAHVKLAVHLSSYQDETSDLCHWHVPETHTLETWGDARGYDGTVTIMQPLIAPLYDGKSAYEVLALLSENPDLTAHDAVKE